MANRLSPIIDALEDLSEKIKGSNTSTNTLKESHGWNFPHLTASNISSIVDAVRKRLETVDQEKINAKYKPDIMVSRINTIASEIPPYFWNGNGTEAFRALTALLDWIDAEFSVLYVKKVDWESIDEEDKMPVELAKRIRSLNARVKSIAGNVDELAEKITAINEAHESAIALPTDLESLNEARDQIRELSRVAEKEAAIVNAAAIKAPNLLESIESNSAEATKLVERTHDAYSAATTLGLGAAFDTKARGLAASMWVWVFGLFLSLGVGGGLGYHRIALLEKLIDADTQPSVIWLNLILALFSIAAPVWFAWVSTKQIGQRFRLSEDYAYKASVAKAYEGYRREAVRLDPAFEHRLFGSTLDRLDEAPLRFVELENHGSPWHEVFNFRKSKPAESKEVDQPATPKNALTPKLRKTDDNVDEE